MKHVSRLVVRVQIAALMERCKRNEEDAAEKARTVDALRRKLALAGRPCSSGSSSGIGPGGSTGPTTLAIGSGFSPTGSPTRSLGSYGAY